MARAKNLGSDQLESLPTHLRGNMFWQQQGLAIANDIGGQDAWWSALEHSWGIPGRGIWVHNRLVACVIYGPVDAFIRAAHLQPRATPDALFIATLWVDEAYIGRGFTKLLVQAVAKDAVTRNISVIEAYGLGDIPDPVMGPHTHRHHFWEQLGFVLYRDGVNIGLHRCETQRTLSWTSTVAGALAGLAAQFRNEKPAPRRALEATVPK